MTLWLFDLDGTLVDSSHRAEHAENEDWDTWHTPELIAKDSPIADVIPYFSGGRFRFGEHAFLTGRSSVCRADTLKWLQTHGFAQHYTPLLMRPEGNSQKVCELKQDALRVLSAKMGRRPIVLLEDHPRTVEILRADPILQHVTVVRAPDQTVDYLRAWEQWA